MTRILVRVVQAVIVAITNVHSWYTIAIVTGVEVAKTGLGFILAHRFRLIGTVAAIVVAITIPLTRDAAVIWTLETVGGTLACRTKLRVLVGRGVVGAGKAAIVVRVTEPKVLHADVCMGTLEHI